MASGAPRRLDQSDRDQIIAIITDGGSRNLAASIIGCSPNTIRAESERDEAFLHALKRAEADSEMFHVRRIREGKAGWQSSAWFLERKWPKRWGQKNYGSGGGAFDRQQLKRMAETLVSFASASGAGAVKGK